MRVMKHEVVSPNGERSLSTWVVLGVPVTIAVPSSGSSLCARSRSVLEHLLPNPPKIPCSYNRRDREVTPKSFQKLPISQLVRIGIWRVHNSRTPWRISGVRLIDLWGYPSLGSNRLGIVSVLLASGPRALAQREGARLIARRS
jgi:hypothetical protein